MDWGEALEARSRLASVPSHWGPPHSPVRTDEERQIRHRIDFDEPADSNGCRHPATYPYGHDRCFTWANSCGHGTEADTHRRAVSCGFEG